MEVLNWEGIFTPHSEAAKRQEHKASCRCSLLSPAQKWSLRLVEIIYYIGFCYDGLVFLETIIFKISRLVLGEIQVNWSKEIIHYICKKSNWKHTAWEFTNFCQYSLSTRHEQTCFSSSKKSTTCKEDGDLWLWLVHPGAAGGLLWQAHW